MDRDAVRDLMQKIMRFKVQGACHDHSKEQKEFAYTFTWKLLPPQPPSSNQSQQQYVWAEEPLWEGKITPDEAEGTPELFVEEWQLEQFFTEEKKGMKLLFDWHIKHRTTGRTSCFGTGLDGEVITLGDVYSSKITMPWTVRDGRGRGRSCLIANAHM